MSTALVPLIFRWFPGKTWEGLLGGMLLSGAVCVGLVWWSGHYFSAGFENMMAIGSEIEASHSTSEHWSVRVPLWMSFGGGGLFGVVGQCGDLLASMLKRDAGIKDSGASVPGFGGFLDVVDSPILVAPVAYWFIRCAVCVG